MDERAPRLETIGGGITVVDTGMTGQLELNAVYVVGASEPALVETGPEADADVVIEALGQLGMGRRDLAHLVVTHVHLDHAGGSGTLLREFPGTRVWVHERGAPHLADPTRLLASTDRTYGPERRERYFGGARPCPDDRIRAVVDGDRVRLGDRSLEVLYTPGHASHHVALFDDGTGSLFTGEAIGSHLPWADCYRPALPPPEVDVPAGLASIERMRERRPARLLTSHFGPVANPDEAFARAADRIRAWSETVRRELEGRPDRDADDLVPVLREQARAEYESDSGTPFDEERYDALGTIRMNAMGLARYWRKTWEELASATGAR